MRRVLPLALAIGAALGCVAGPPKAPDLAGARWLRGDAPEGLRGGVALVEFWTFG